MNDYSKKILKVPTVTFVREQDQGKQPVLDVRNLGIDFGGLTAVDSFNITIGPTEISGLIGPNGAGKTTIFNLLTGVYQPTRGSVLVNGIDIKGMPVYKVNKLGIARTFQNIRLFTDMTVLDNVKVGLHNSMKCSFFSSVLHLPATSRPRSAPMRRLWSCWISWGLRNMPVRRQEACPTASSAVWRSSGRWRPILP